MSTNAQIKSGIDAHSQIIPGEDPADLDALKESFLLLYHPADPNQLALVDTLIATEWTQRRLRRIEAQNFELDALTRIERLLDAANRRYLRTLKALQGAQQLTPEIGFVPKSDILGTGDEFPRNSIAVPSLGPSRGISPPVPKLAPPPLLKYSIHAGRPHHRDRDRRHRAN
jgi:hypothetical protein